MSKDISKALVFLIGLSLFLPSFLMGGEVRSESNDTTAVAQRMADAINKFSFKLLQQTIEPEANSNIFISPFSVSFALGMTYNGAAGETVDSMHRVLEYGDLTLTEINQAYRDLIDQLPQRDPKVTFQIANSIWHRDTIRLKQRFHDIASLYFQSEVTSLDFDDPNSVAVINSWVKQKTHGKISEIISPPINREISLILINAIYFKGTWKYEFDKALTKEEPFYLLDSTRATAQMMTQKGDFSILSDTDFLAVKFPYGEGNFSMIAFLPGKNIGPDNLIGRFNAENWNRWREKFYQHEATIFFPKFKLTYYTDFNQILSALGMGIAFDPDRANFGNMTSQDPIYLSQVLHKAFIQVDEEGTEAAAVTAVIGLFATSIGSEPQEIIIRFDRPFVFAICDNTTGTILFMGKIVKPVWE